jgi:bifunctional DNA-binding transcriptional regulator/antitoxin component of YhaV-PrlF toxin-antitoxin module
VDEDHPRLRGSPGRDGRCDHCFMVGFMSMGKRMSISRGGQISIPAPIRHRWATSTVTLDDQGDRIVLTPAPDDPIAAAEGALAADFAGLDTGEMRRYAREDDRVAAARRRRP